MNGKRLSVTICPACDGTVIAGERHGPDDDLREIRARDAAYNSVTVLVDPLSNQPTGRLQMAADRRMLLRMLDAELAEQTCAACGHGRASHSMGGLCDGGGTECYCVRFPDAPDFATGPAL